MWACLQRAAAAAALNELAGSIAGLSAADDSSDRSGLTAHISGWLLLRTAYKRGSKGGYLAFKQGCRCNNDDNQ
jgi:hypothetical protein